MTDNIWSAGSVGLQQTKDPGVGLKRVAMMKVIMQTNCVIAYICTNVNKISSNQIAAEQLSQIGKDFGFKFTEAWKAKAEIIISENS